MPGRRRRRPPRWGDIVKRLVLCCDGTWNTPDESTGGDATPTNVTKIALQVAEHDAAGVEQRVYYDRGVGTGRFDHLAGGMAGLGLTENVKQAYAYLVESYEPGDEVYLVGFSRGAYTARSLAGLIRNSGLLRPEHRHRVDEAYALYRDRSDATHPNAVAAELFRRTWSRATDVHIHFVGVFDTVGALGIPGIGLHALTRRWQFHDTALSSRVCHAAQALALHERRGPFRPALWDESPDRTDPVRQVWFTGVHSDVGGGYPEPDLAEIPLRWMVERATAAGLVFRPVAFAAMPDGASAQMRSRGEWTAPSTWGVRHESRTFPYTLLRPFDRTFRGEHGGVQQVASSARARDGIGLRTDRPPTGGSFADAGAWCVGPYPDPPGLPVGATMTASVRPARRLGRTGIVLRSGGEYEITASGTWCGGSTPAGRPGASWLRRCTGWLRRSPERPRSELTGRVGARTFPIGEGCRHVAAADGELVCWASGGGARHAAGALDVRVTRRR